MTSNLTVSTFFLTNVSMLVGNFGLQNGKACFNDFMSNVSALNLFTPEVYFPVY